MTGFRLAALRVRKKVVAGIPPRLLEIYERARGRGRRPALASLYRGQACGGCFLTIPPRLCVEVSIHGVVDCPHCGCLILESAEVDPTVTHQQGTPA